MGQHCGSKATSARMFETGLENDSDPARRCATVATLKNVSLGSHLTFGKVNHSVSEKVMVRECDGHAAYAARLRLGAPHLAARHDARRAHIITWGGGETDDDE